MSEHSGVPRVAQGGILWLGLVIVFVGKQVLLNTAPGAMESQPGPFNASCQAGPDPAVIGGPAAGDSCRNQSQSACLLSLRAIAGVQCLPFIRQM